MLDLLDFSNELVHTDEAARLNMDKMNESIENISTLSENLHKELENYNAFITTEDKFAEVMVPFSIQSQREVEELKKLMNQMKESYSNVAKHFAFDINKYPMKECFSDVSNFKSTFAKAYGKIVRASEGKELKQRTQNSQSISQQQQVVDGSSNTGMHSFIKRLAM